MTTSINQLVRRSRTDHSAQERLWALVMREMQQLAHARLKRERAGHALETDALVNELYLKLGNVTLQVNDRAHLMAVAARQLRCILVDYARANNCAKRGGDALHITLHTIGKASSVENADVLDLHEALQQLESHDERTASMVELHYFGGLSFKDIAAALEVSIATVTRKMRLGKAWLHSRMS